MLYWSEPCVKIVMGLWSRLGTWDQITSRRARISAGGLVRRDGLSVGVGIGGIQ